MTGLDDRTQAGHFSNGAAITMNKLTKQDVKAYQRELRRQGFAFRHKDRSKVNGNEWEYGKWYTTPNRLGTAYEQRDVTVQLSDHICRASHMLFTDANRRHGNGTTTPTAFTTIGEMILAIAVEVSRYDQHRYGIEYVGEYNNEPTRWIVDRNKIVRVTTRMLVNFAGPPVEKLAASSAYGRSVADDVILDPVSGKYLHPTKAVIEQSSAFYPNEPNRTAYCDNCKRRRPMHKLSIAGLVCECIDTEDCLLSQRRQGFINGT